MSRSDFQRFLIVGVQRTGSSALAELINTHPAIATGWEWTEHAKYWQKLDILSRSLSGDFANLDANSRAHIEGSVSEDTVHLGFRRLFGASNKWFLTPATSLKLFADRFRSHLRWLSANPDVRVIHIVRNNHLEWVKSKFVARELSSFVGTSYPEDVRVRVPISNARARVRAKIWIDRELSSIANSNPYLQLEYEQFSQGLNAAAQNAVSFLGEDPGQLRAEKTTINRQSTRSTQEYLINYDELTAALSDLDRS